MSGGHLAPNKSTNSETYRVDNNEPDVVYSYNLTEDIKNGDLKVL